MRARPLSAGDPRAHAGQRVRRVGLDSGQVAGWASDAPLRVTSGARPDPSRAREPRRGTWLLSPALLASPRPKAGCGCPASPAFGSMGAARGSFSAARDSSAVACGSFSAVRGSSAAARGSFSAARESFPVASGSFFAAGGSGRAALESLPAARGLFPTACGSFSAEPGSRQPARGSESVLRAGREPPARNVSPGARRPEPGVAGNTTDPQRVGARPRAGVTARGVCVRGGRGRRAHNPHTQQAVPCAR